MHAHVEVKVFLRQDCPQCPGALEACAGVEELRVFDVDRAESLTEAAVHHIAATPTVIVIDNDGREIASWRGEVPDRGSLLTLLGN